MTKSILVVGGTKEQRLKKITQFLADTLRLPFLPSHPDILVIQGLESIGIEEVRSLKRKLSFKPYIANYKVAIFTEAESLTLPAQNSLLKILEEPPKNSFLILSSPSADLLLPTVVSRCQLIKIPPEIEEFPQKDYLYYRKLLISLLSKSPGERLRLAEKFAKDKTYALEFCLKMIFTLRKMMGEKTKKNLAQNLRLFQNTYRLIQDNVNPNLALGNLFLSLL